MKWPVASGEWHEVLNACILECPTFDFTLRSTDVAVLRLFTFILHTSYFYISHCEELSIAYTLSPSRRDISRLYILHTSYRRSTATFLLHTSYFFKFSAFCIRETVPGYLLAA